MVLMFLMFLTSCPGLEPDSPEALRISQLFLKKNTKTEWHQTKEWQKQLLEWTIEGNYPPLKGLIEHYQLPVNIRLQGKPLLNCALSPYFYNAQAQEKFVVYLLLKGANPNAENRTSHKFARKIPIEYGVSGDCPEIVFEKLLRYGFKNIDKFKPMSNGMTAEQWLIQERDRMDYDEDKIYEVFYYLSVLKKLDIFYQELSLAEIQTQSKQKMVENLTCKTKKLYDITIKFK